MDEHTQLKTKTGRTSQEKFFSFAAALTEEQAANYIGLSIPYLRQDRMNGYREGRTPGPPYLKIGRSIRYLRKDLDDWLEKHRVTHKIPDEEEV